MGEQTEGNGRASNGNDRPDHQMPNIGGPKSSSNGSTFQSGAGPPALGGVGGPERLSGVMPGIGNGSQGHWQEPSGPIVPRVGWPQLQPHSWARAGARGPSSTRASATRAGEGKGGVPMGRKS